MKLYLTALPVVCNEVVPDYWGCPNLTRLWCPPLGIARTLLGSGATPARTLLGSGAVPGTCPNLSRLWCNFARTFRGSGAVPLGVARTIRGSGATPKEVRQEYGVRMVQTPSVNIVSRPVV